ncbi:MAG: DUF2461 domain-containing protein [Actinomycetota bacterium]|nr:DUF2461 domain-containing protein [Actinomycetota bacterium]
MRAGSRPAAVLSPHPPFRGWPVEAVEFFQGLEADNSKAYWHAHKAVYVDSVKAPMDALLAELALRFGPGRLFRPNRDMRFSKGDPYRTEIAARVGATGYVSMSAGVLSAGAGMVHMAPDQLDRYRKAVDADRTGRALESAVARVRAEGHECEPHDPLKTVPRGYPRDHPRADLLRARGLIMWRRWPVGPWLGTPEAKERVVDVLAASAPLGGWLTDHVGEPTNDQRGR